MMGFLFGEGTDTPDAAALQRKRQLIDGIQAQSVSGTPRNLGEGLSAIGQAIFARIGDKRHEAREDKERDRVSSQFDAITRGLMGGSTMFTPAAQQPAPQAPVSPFVAPEPVAAGPVPDTPEAVGNDTMDALGLPRNNMAALIVETAESIGADPLDLATAISYETAGTFDPTKAGPTTQWGQHRGLIQFGEPQAQQYGVNWDDPLNSQLGANGAVARYLRENGFQPGMGMADLYSTINAGAPGLYNRSDANNGGAPGTVMDKVQGMDDHRRKAAAFMGGTYTPMAAPQAAGPPINPQIISQLSELAANPYLPEGQKMIAQALIQQQVQGMDPMRAMELERAQLELEALRNPTPDQPNSVREYQFYADQERAQGREPLPYGEWSIMDEAATVPGAPTTGAVPPGYSRIPDPNNPDNPSGFVDVPIKGGKEDNSSEMQAAAAQAQDSIDLIDSVMADPALASITGAIQGALPPMTQAGVDLNVKIDQIAGQAFLSAFESLKGGGQITEREGIAAQNAMARLNRRQSTEAFKEALAELREIMERGLARARGEDIPDDYGSANDGWQDVNGVRIRKVN